MKKLYLSNNEVKGQVLSIARQLQQDKWMPDYIVGLTRGGIVPATMLSHYLNVPMEALKVSLRDGGDTESNCWMAEHAFGYDADKKNILIVDDINDTGATLNWIKGDWPSLCMPNDDIWINDTWHKNVRFATLVNNEASDFTSIDYTAKEINKLDDPVWVVFPWENWWE